MTLKWSRWVEDCRWTLSFRVSLSRGGQCNGLVPCMSPIPVLWACVQSACSGVLTVASIFFLVCTSLLGSSFGSRFHGYGIGHWRPIFWQESSVIFNSFRSTALNLSASHSQGLAATPIVSVVQKSVMSMGVGTCTKDAVHLSMFSVSGSKFDPAKGWLSCNKVNSFSGLTCMQFRVFNANE